MPYKFPELHKEKIKNTNRNWYLKNKVKILLQNRNKYHTNIKQEKKRAKKYYQKHKLELLLKAKKRRKNINLVAKIRYQKIKNNPQYKLAKNLRTKLYLSLKKKQIKGSAIRSLGCSIIELQTHLESKFKKGMNWSNWGVSGWHIDHIKPLSSFELSNPKELLKACHYTNLQPLWAKENLSKNNRII